MYGLIAQIAGVVFLSIACEMIMPDGGMKKYIQLAVGFVMMTVLIKPIAEKHELPEFDFEFDNVYEEEELKSQSDAFVLMIHKRNLEKKAEEICGPESQAYVELYSDGRVKSVKIVCDKKDIAKASEVAEKLGCGDVEMTEREE